MLDLTLDTSTDTHFFLLSSEKHLEERKIFESDRRLSGELLPSLEVALTGIGRNVRDIRRIFIGTGPGSPTGTRVGVAVAKGLSLALSVPLYPFCSLPIFLPETLSDGPFTVIKPGKCPFFCKGTLKNGKLVGNVETGHSESVPEDAFVIPRGKNPPNFPLLFSYLAELVKHSPGTLVLPYTE